MITTIPLNYVVIYMQRVVRCAMEHKHTHNIKIQHQCTAKLIKCLHWSAMVHNIERHTCFASEYIPSGSVFRDNTKKRHIQAHVYKDVIHL